MCSDLHSSVWPCVSACAFAEIEMVVMEKCKISDVSTLTEQNITDEEKTAAAAARTEGQRSRYAPPNHRREPLCLHEYIPVCHCV